MAKEKIQFIGDAIGLTQGDIIRKVNQRGRNTGNFLMILDLINNTESEPDNPVDQIRTIELIVDENDASFFVLDMKTLSPDTLFRKLGRMSEKQLAFTLSAISEQSFGKSG